MDIATSLPHTKRYTNLWGLWLDVCSKTANHISCGRIACHNICVSDSVIWHYFGQSCAQFGGALPYNLKAALTISKRTFGFEVHILLLHQESYDYGSFSCRRRGCCNGESSRPSLLWPKFDFWTWRRKWIKLVGSRPYSEGFSPTLKIPVWSWNSAQEEPPREICSNKHYYCYYDYFYNYHYRKRK